MTCESEVPPELVAVICRLLPRDDRLVRAFLRVYFARMRGNRRQGRWEIDQSPEGVVSEAPRWVATEVD